MREIAVLALAVALIACADVEPPAAESSGTASLGGNVTYRYKDDIGEAAAQAWAYCGKYRKRAFLRSTTRAGDDNLATYDCR